VKRWHLIPTPSGWQRVFIELPTMRTVVGMLAGFAILAVATVSLVSCGGHIPGPKTGPGTEMPCGANRVSCLPFDGTHSCCEWGSHCSMSGCDPDAPIGDLGSRKPIARTPEHP
jgi:hypothetical protein